MRCNRAALTDLDLAASMKRHSGDKPRCLSTSGTLCLVSPDGSSGICLRSRGRSERETYTAARHSPSRMAETISVLASLMRGGLSGCRIRDAHIRPRRTVFIGRIEDENMSENPSSTSVEFTYDTALRQSSTLRSDLAVRGKVISETSIPAAGPRGCIPILWCLCVHDSPDNPCPCNGPIIWCPKRSILRRRKLEPQAEGLVEITVEAATKVFLEDSREVGGKGSGTQLLRMATDGRSEPLAETLWLQEFTPMRIDRLQKALELIERHPQLSAIAKKKGKGFWGKIVAAFEAGWEIGTLIDEEVGLSDTIADWLEDTFGPWPF